MMIIFKDGNYEYQLFFTNKWKIKFIITQVNFNAK